MLSKSKPLYLLRIFVIGTLIASFIYLSTLFVQHYIAFEKLNKHLLETNSPVQDQSTGLYKLFVNYTEADNLFRLYTINFDRESYNAYNDKLENIRRNIDSLMRLPNIDCVIFKHIPSVEEKKAIEQGLGQLRKTINDLVFLSQDSLSTLQNTAQWQITRAEQISTDSIVNRILRDTVLQKVSADTIIRKKQNLFKRIFKAEDEMVISNSITQELNSNYTDAIYRNIEFLNNEQQRLYIRKSTLLRNKFKALMQKEREAVQANYRLLNALRDGIQSLKEQEVVRMRIAEKKDIIAHRDSVHRFEKQIIAALFIMLFMIALILFYQSNAAIHEKRLREEKEYAAHVAEEKTSILANVSHEVRTPISSLLGIIDILKRNNDSKVLNPEYLDSAVQEIALINSSINDILNLSKLEVGKLEVKNEYFSPYRILIETFNLHRYQAQKKGLSLEQHINLDSGLEIYGSAFRVKQITSNLLSNAIKYTAKGTVSLIAEISGSKPKLIITVKDTGIGIAKEQQEHVFRKYYMAESKGKIGGFGLGLYISNLLAKQLKGKISLESIPEKGSTFCLTLPIEKTRRAHSAQESYSFQDLPPDINMVFIDDNRINLMYLKHFFKNIAAQVHLFEDPAAALSFIDKNKVDVVVTDLLMPAINGWAVLEHIKKTKKNIRVFLSTADPINMEDQQQNSAYAFEDILSKPLGEHEFVSKIRNGKYQ